MNSTVDRQKEFRLKVAELCGWSEIDNGAPKQPWGYEPSDGIHFKQWSALPDYCNDLNAMHEAESCEIICSAKLGHQYKKQLIAITGGNYRLWHATALQRAEAFVKIMEATSVQKPKEIL